MLPSILALFLACWVQAAAESLKIGKILYEISQQDADIARLGKLAAGDLQSILELNTSLTHLRKNCPKMMGLGSGLAPFISQSLSWVGQQNFGLKKIEFLFESAPGKTVQFNRGIRQPPDPCGFMGPLFWSPTQTVLVYEHQKGPHPGGLLIEIQNQSDFFTSKATWQFFRNTVLPL
jgi:hypothetical protein